MSDNSTFTLPDVGEGLTEAEVVNWRVAVGDPIQINDVLLEIETAKSLVELPSPFAGIVDEILVEQGETVPVGTALIAIASTAAATKAPEADVLPANAAEEESSAAKPAVLVGYGPVAAAGRRRKLRNTAAAGAPVQGSSRSQSAKPPVRQLAKRLGVDLASIAAGPDGVVTRGHVEIAAAAATSGPAAPSVDATAPASTSWPQGSVPENETRSPIKGVQRAMADAMVRSAFTAPHATLWLSVDMTATLELVRRLRSTKGWEHVRVTPMLILAKAILLAVRRNPLLNASWDEANQKVVVKHRVNLGIAAATPRGLLVPNIKGADGLGLMELAAALNNLVVAAREGKTRHEDLVGGSLTITNIGVFGMDGATPILNPGETAILAFGATRQMPWVVEGELAVRDVAQLSLSIDHRLVDGQMASRFLSDVAAILERPQDVILYA